MARRGLGRSAIALLGMARPDQLSLIAVVYAAGVLVALARGHAGANILLGLAALLPVAIAVHYANEYADYETDAITSRTDYSGGSGALHATGLGPDFARRAFAAATAIAVLAVAASAALGLPVPALCALAVILVLGIAYSVGPQLAWRGLGEVTNSLLGGLVLPLYGVAVVGAVPDLIDVLTFLPFTAVVFANLLATQWPDRHADERVGKRTLAVSLDVDRLRALYVAAAAAGVLGLVALAASALVPWPLVALAVPTAVLLGVGARRYGRVESPAITVHAMVALAFAHVLVAACLW